MMTREDIFEAINTSEEFQEAYKNDGVFTDTIDEICNILDTNTTDLGVAVGIVETLHGLNKAYFTALCALSNLMPDPTSIFNDSYNGFVTPEVLKEKMCNTKHILAEFKRMKPEELNKKFNRIYSREIATDPNASSISTLINGKIMNTIAEPLPPLFDANGNRVSLKGIWKIYSDQNAESEPSDSSNNTKDSGQIESTDDFMIKAFVDDMERYELYGMTHSDEYPEDYDEIYGSSDSLTDDSFLG